MKVYNAIYNSLQVLASNAEDLFKENALDALAYLEETFLPSGSGFDSGTHIITEGVKKGDEKIRIQANFHHMNGDGYYTGWTDHIVTVTPSLDGYLNIRISGRDKDNIKEYILDVLNSALDSELVGYQRDKYHAKILGRDE